ncbi:electron transport complex subunit E [Vibrio natriegens]|uniref:Ion-translocating oxidoreductase complex subunit E n=1 Tax=Vibrio natriegens NBRC 15636 = ATCC 14048 = DSM 759 TaxID=1219067 RepID=A0AAN0Y7T4_VIBNA|nr:electron transport complex subunit E [Vibrio natriegens]ALR18110.1 electron transport complex RsxE subunit [Vibrio natriegens NBRC 15636 = ATCC 14048 = DSM 759]ANQ15612.1 electron transport complex subunit RsxE [Vibrio natriegens NBRC 15636 = ATCC 14048 = DSM 759]EPM41586.1 electron transporter RsxE [Vibrio natriegens NBRC 15636 = ATCC 14048 = DSM 759]MDX6029017.1 electron transport complex subunit E [Vibrio natriegens NBRC 15636 = ATCC 14048 = DSM 759]UUI14272.1 electron transport complex 
MSESNQYKSTMSQGLWGNNIVLKQSLALCPLLAVTSSATNGLGLGLATMVVMVAANTLNSMAKGVISKTVRIPVNVIIIATLVTLTDALLNAYLHSLHKVLGLFIPLIVTNCAILGRVESFASRSAVMPSIVDGLFMGLGFTWVLTMLGAIREILGSGTLFSNAHLLLGERFAFLEMVIIDDYQGVLLVILPPGGFLVLGLVLALKQKYESMVANTTPALAHSTRG